MSEKDIIHSERSQYQLKSKMVIDGLFEAFDTLVKNQLTPHLDKMIEENKLHNLRAFSDWNTGFNDFLLEIFGFELPEGYEKILDPNIIQDSFHYKENLYAVHDKLLKLLINEMNKQNITGKRSEIIGEGAVAIEDYNYGILIRWTCKPQETVFDKARNAVNN